MKITENNYEAWMLDHLEGRLDAAQTALLMRFLSEHPEIEVDTNMELVALPRAEEAPVHAFSHLRKPAGAIVATAGFDGSNYEEAFAAFHEGDLDQQQEAGLRRFVEQNPALLVEFDLFGMLKTEPDSVIVFADKASLRRHRTIPLMARWTIPVSVAAAIALFVMFNPFGREPMGTDPGTGQVVALPEVKTGEGAPIALVVQAADEKGSPAADDVSPVQAHEPAQVAIARSREIWSVPELRSIAAKPVMSDRLEKQVLIEGSRYYTCLYADIRLRDQLNFQQEVEQQGLQTIYGDAKAEAGKGSFDLWTIARLGVKGFNFITRSDIEFTKARDEDGKVTDFAIGGEAVRIAHSSK